MKKLNKIIFLTKILISTKLPNPITETRVSKLVFIIIPCLKFWSTRVLQWEESKTKNSGETQHLYGGGGVRIYCFCLLVDMNIMIYDYETHSVTEYRIYIGCPGILVFE